MFIMGLYVSKTTSDIFITTKMSIFFRGLRDIINCKFLAITGLFACFLLDFHFFGAILFKNWVTRIKLPSLMIHRCGHLKSSISFAPIHNEKNRNSNCFKQYVTVTIVQFDKMPQQFLH